MYVNSIILIYTRIYKGTVESRLSGIRFYAISIIEYLQFICDYRLSAFSGLFLNQKVILLLSHRLGQ